MTMAGGKSSRNGWFSLKTIVLVYLPLLALAVLSIIVVDVSARRVTTSVSAAAGTVDWRYAGTGSYKLDPPDGTLVQTTYNAETDDIVISKPVQLSQVAVTIMPGTRVRVEYAAPCTYDFYFTPASRNEGDAAVIDGRIKAFATDAKLPAALDGKKPGSDISLPAEARNFPAFEYQASADDCKTPVALSLVKADSVHIGSLTPRRIGAAMFNQTIVDGDNGKADGKIEIFNQTFMADGRYKVSEGALGLGDTVVLEAPVIKAPAVLPDFLKPSSGLTSQWNGMIYLTDVGALAKVSSLQRDVKVVKTIGGYDFKLDTWQAAYTQPLFQIIVSIIGFFVGLSTLPGLFGPKK